MARQPHRCSCCNREGHNARSCRSPLAGPGRAQRGAAVIAFWAPGQPQPKGSAKGFFNAKLGRVLITNDSTKAKPWAAVVTLAAEQARAGAPTLEGAVQVELGFQMQRPKAHYDSKGRLRPTAPDFCPKKPDIDKVTRTVLDALTRASVWRDDAQVASLTVTKIYGEPGVHITVKPAE